MKQLIIGSTALVARELARFHVDIAALSETRRAKDGGYSFFWSGRTSEERREAGVGFAIRSHLVSKLASLPRGLNDRLLAMQLQLTNKQKAFFVGVLVLPNWVIDSWISREMSECVVSNTVARANRVGLWRCATKNFCYYPPPPLNRDGFWRSRKMSTTTPPPHWIGRASGDHGKFLLLPPPVSCCAPPRLPAPDPPLVPICPDYDKPWRSKGPVLWATRRAYRSSPRFRETHYPWRRQCSNRNRPPHIARSYWPTIKVQANATSMASYSYSPVLPTNPSSLTHCSVYQPATRRPGCILAQSTGIWLTTLSQGRKIQVTSEWQSQCVWGRVLDWPQTIGVKADTTHPATKTTPRKKTYQEAMY